MAEPKANKYVVKIGCDNTEIMSALDEVEKKVEILQKAVDRLMKTFKEWGKSADA